MEMMNETNRKETITQNIQSLPKDAELLEKKMRINNLEQTLLIRKY
jgi:hypothetical protein